MADATTTSQLIPLLSVLLGGALTAGGGFVGQFFTHRWTQEREEGKLAKEGAREAEKVRRERIEALVKAVYEHGHWLDDRKQKMIFEKADHNAPSPLSEARMLQELHFPDLGGEVLAIMKAQGPMIAFVGQQRLAHMKNQQEWAAARDDKPYYDAYVVYLAAISALTKKCREMLYANTTPISSAPALASAGPMASHGKPGPMLSR